MMTRKIGNKLAQELGAVKYVEYSDETEQGAKILINETAFACIGEIKDEKCPKQLKCNLIIALACIGKIKDKKCRKQLKYNHV